MGGKHSRHQREQKHQQRKPKRERKSSKHGETEPVGGGSSATSDSTERPVTPVQHLPEGVTQRDRDDTIANVKSDVTTGPAVNVSERDTEGVDRVAVDETEDAAKSSVTITICMLKMEPNAAITAERPSATIEPVEEEDAASSLSRPAAMAPGCECLENGNVEPSSGAKCSCSSNTPTNVGAGTVDNRLNNNEPQQLSGTEASAPSASNGPTPSTSSCSTSATASLTTPPTVPAAATLAMWSSTLPTGANVATPSSPSMSFVIGGHDPASFNHLLHRLRHLHHHHHHHHHHLMHLHHLHHHLPTIGGIVEVPQDAPGADDWRQHILHQWNPLGIGTGSTVRPVDPPAPNVGTPLGPSASPVFPDIDIDLKDKLEGLKLGNSGAAGQRSSNNNLVEATGGEHPYSVGECPTCCAMAMAANASGSLSGLLGTGAGSSSASGSPIFNGNVGEVEEKILNTSNQPASVTSEPGGEKVSDGAAPVTANVMAVDNDTSSPAAAASSDQISTEPDNTTAGPSSAGCPSATGTSTASNNSGKDAERTVTADGNSSNPATTATASNGSAATAVPMGSPNPTSDSPPTTTSTAGSVLSPSTSSAGAKSTSSPASSTTPCCNRKQSSLFSSLSLAGRRSRSSNARNGNCCSNATDCGASSAAVTSPEQQRSFTNWISGGGQKQHSKGSGSKNNRSSTTAAASGSGTKSKKPNWRISLNCTIALARSGGNSAGQSKSASPGTNATGLPKSSGKASSAQASNGAFACGSMESGIIASGSGVGPSLRGSSLLSGGVSSKLLKGETDKDDSCVCTAYRKMSESPPPPSPPLPAVASVASPSRMASSRLSAESAEWLVDEAMQGSGLVPLNLHMLGSHRSAGSGCASSSSIGGIPAPLLSFGPEPIPASMLSSHHHHHHHAMAAALVAADHHPSFFFPAGAGASNHHTHHGPAGAAGGSAGAGGGSSLFGALPLGSSHSPANDVILLSDSPMLFDLTSEDFSVEDCDERARIQRELEIREGVDAPPNFHPRRLMSGGTIASGPAANHPIAFIYSRDLMQQGLLVANKLIQPLDAAGGCAGAIAGRSPFGRLRIHSQVDFIHCLVPDLQKITSCSFYWGKMDRYEAERLLEGKPEGTFLLRDSAQEEFLFSVSFRKYNRSLHARIEQFNHKFSFDSRDPGVFTASTVTGLLEHYKDPSCVMFFEPMLTFPLNRSFSFSLQQLCRAVIVSNTTYDGINELTLPKSLKAYLKEYHYRQRVRFRPMDEHLYSNA